ncbi:MAG: ACP S-malonyltransferase [Proteobacteria bacterium]|nr:ACP S-malonyltransferase [Pseudomonadota bacterium]
MQFDAIVFPGQGAQKLGMAADFVETFPVSAEIFEKANRQLPFDVYEVCHRDEARLNRTDYTQPCIVLAEIAMYEALKQSYGLAPSYFAGHSLGEYSALVAAGVLPFELALEIVHKRGQLMHTAATGGGMSAIIMDQIPYAEILTLANQFEVDIANDNSIQQIVLSGKKTAVDKAVDVLAEKYQDIKFRAVALTVSAAFHSRWMQPVEHEFHRYLSQHKDSINPQNLKQVASNYLGQFYSGDKDELVSALAKQLSGSVKWRENMDLLKNSSILELGPNRPLRGFFKSIGLDVKSVTSVKSAKRVFTS